jgi:hypothetical protein
MTERPNMREFSTIAGLILDELLENHPVRSSVSDYRAMRAMKVDDRTQKLESGRMFKEVFAATLMWLTEEGFIDAAGLIPGERARLTTRALAALNAMPPNLGGKTIGESIAEARSAGDANESSSRIASVFGDFIGSAAGSFTKSMSGG